MTLEVIQRQQVAEPVRGRRSRPLQAGDDRVRPGDARRPLAKGARTWSDIFWRDLVHQWPSRLVFESLYIFGPAGIDVNARPGDDAATMTGPSNDPVGRHA